MFKSNNIKPEFSSQLGTILSETGFNNVSDKKYAVPLGSWAGVVSKIIKNI